MVVSKNQTICLYKEVSYEKDKQNKNNNNRIIIWDLKIFGVIELHKLLSK